MKNHLVFNNLAKIINKRVAGTIKQLLLISKPKTKEFVDEIYLIFLAKMIKIQAKLQKIMNQTTQVRLMFAKL